MAHPRKLLKIGEVADLLGISIHTARHWHARGEWPSVRFGHRSLRFRPEDIHAWVREHRTDPKESKLTEVDP